MNCKQCKAKCIKGSELCEQCKEEQAVSRLADDIMYGEEDAQYMEDAGLEFGNK